MPKHYTTKDKFLVWGTDGILTTEKGFIISIEEGFELVDQLQKFLQEHDQNDVDEYNNDLMLKLLNQDRQLMLGARPQKPKPKQGFVYFVQADKRFFKIGSTTNLSSRFKAMKVSSPNQLEMMAYFRTDDCRKDEESAHQYFAKNRVRGEWFDIDLRDAQQFTDKFKGKDEFVIGGRFD
jgi:hypothetical protein